MSRLDKALEIFGERHGISDPAGDLPLVVHRYLAAGCFSQEEKQELAGIYDKLNGEIK